MTPRLTTPLMLAAGLFMGPGLAQASESEPTLDELLGLVDPADPDPDPEGDDPATISRELDRKLTGQEIADQFAQAVAEMDEVAQRLGDG